MNRLYMPNLVSKQQQPTMHASWALFTKDLSRSLQSTLSHLEAPKKRGGQHASRMPSYFQSKPSWVHPRDRIPYWHVAPGDQVAVIKGEEAIKDKTGTVERVDRERNLVFLKEDAFKTKKRQPALYRGESLVPGYKSRTIYVPRPIHISNVRLRAELDSVEYTTTRLKRTAPTWDRFNRRFHWKRYGLVPELASPDFDGWLEIKWPALTAAKSSPPQKLDAESTQQATWNPTADELVDGRAGELEIPERDLGGDKHSRANRTKRWNETKELRRKHLGGRLPPNHDVLL